MRRAIQSVALLALVATPSPSQDPPKDIGALIKQLELEDQRDAAIAELAKLGSPATEALIEALDAELERGRNDSAGAVVRALGALGTEGTPAKATLEKLRIGDNKDLARLALRALLSIRASESILIADYSDNRVLEIDGNGKVVNEIADLSGPWDVEILANGNYLITEFSVSRVREVTKQGRTVWSLDRGNVGLKNPYDADRLPNGNTLVADTFGGRVIEVNPQKNIVWSYSKGIRPFDVERLDNGNTLISDVMLDRVIEVDPNGVIVWEVKGMPNVHDADRLPNGNTLITLRTVNRVVELDPDGKEVFRLDKLNSPSDADRLPNGNTVVAENGMVREFDPQGKEVWRREMTWAVEVNRY